MRGLQTITRGSIVALLFLGYPWAVVTLQRIVPGPAMMLGVVPVAATAALLGTRAGLIAAAVAVGVDNVIARSLKVIALNLLPWASLTSLCAYLVLVFSIGALRRLWLNVDKSRRALEDANRALAEEAKLRTSMSAELRAHATLYSSLINSMVEGVGLFDIDDRFVFANAAAERLFAAERGQLVGQSLRELIDADGVSALASARRNESLNCVTYTLYTRGAGAERRHLLVTETLLCPSDTSSAPILRVMHDFTERERLEQEQRELAEQVQRAQAMQSLGVLAGGVAHDFNNLLTGVLGHAELALLRLERVAIEDARQSLCEIRDFAREAATLAKQMLAYAGKSTLVPETLNLGDIAAEAMRLVQSTVAAHASLEQNVSPALPNVRGDRTQLRQVIVNLVMNAVESLGERRGTIRLTLDTQHIVPDRLGGFWKPERPSAGEHVVLTVTDNGQGMSSDTLSRIFEPYFSTKVTGRGMGLAATQGIVRAHRGSIGVESTPGVGSTFQVLFPPDSEALGISVAPVAPPKPARGQGVVMIIDDEHAVRSTASMMLQELGYQVLLANGCREALNQLALASNRICLVLLDLTMPDLDGRDTLIEMRRAGFSVPVLLISGYHHFEVASLLREPKVVGFLPKPLQFDTLACAIRDALQSRTTADGVAGNTLSRRQIAHSLEIQE